uniref:DOMON domain-containing protein n=1 Tax=Ditylenchus dipsaci TaxID=166011 RepID=A0A915CW83_9BILA
MKHSVKKGKWWSTVGIGDNMSDMDIGVLFLEDGKVKKMIDYYSHSYGPPDEDKDQNWVLHSSKSKLVSNKSGDQVELHFSRVINSPDIEKDKSMDGCVLFQFGASIGKYEVSGTNYSVRKHEEWPDLYKACDLKKRCLQDKHHQSKPLLQPPIGNSTELEGPQGSVESDGILALLTQEITTTTTTTDSTTAQDNTEEQRQPTADVIGSTLTTLLPNSTADDADLLLSSSTKYYHSSTRAFGLEFFAPEYSAKWQGNESTTTTTTTTSSPSSSSTIETTTSEVLSDWASTLATVVEAGDKGLSTTTDSQSSTTTLGAADNTTSNVQTTTSSTSPTSPSTTTSTTTSSTTTRSTTSTTSNPVTDKAEDSQGLKTEGCQVLKPDLDVCKSYMTTYFGQVQSWADKHQEPMENQLERLANC